MKNMKIGLKMALGFGSIIAMMLAAVAVVFVTNFGILRNVESVNVYSALQLKMNGMFSSFNTAKVHANTTYHVINEEANAAFAKNVADVETAFRDLYAHIDQNPTLEDFRADLQAAQAHFETWRDETQEVIDSNTELDQDRENLLESGAALAEISEFLMSDELTWSDRNAIVKDITAFRLEVRPMLYSFDTSGLKGALTNIDEAIRLTQRSRAISLLPAEIENAKRLVDTLTVYRSLAVKFAETTDISFAAVDRAVPAGALADEVIGATVAKIDDAVVGRVSDTRAIVSLSFIIIFAVVAVMVFIAVLVALSLTRAITRPLKKMQEIMKKTGETGDLHYSDEVQAGLLKDAEAKDEIGQSLKAFTLFVGRMVYMGECLKRIAERDLTVEVELLSARDTMGNALNSMLGHLNDMFGDINSVAAQVATASGEIANGSQNLAQGSSEQASTIEEITASITKITEQSEVSSRNAAEVAGFSSSIYQIAIEGNQRMEAMMTSVEEMNEASRAIKNVNKAIEEIAFQTNILALNAAVEAARAGQHGKGFAVVAEEVRNLAGKSANAAKETERLISANIEKANAGLKIARETAESLEKIVAGTEKTNESLEGIVRQSEANSLATEQVKTAVEHVAQVVQQNSATSEESAAASEELSSQAQSLQTLIAEFKLRGDGKDFSSYARLPQKTGGGSEVLPAMRY